MTFPKPLGFYICSRSFPGLEITIFKCHDFSRLSVTVRTLQLVYKHLTIHTKCNVQLRLMGMCVCRCSWTKVLDMSKMLDQRVQFNSVYFVSPIITNYKFPSEGFTIWTHRHPWPLTSHRIRKNSQTTLQGEKVKNSSGEQQRRIPLQDGHNNRCHVTRGNHYRVTSTFNEYDRVCE